MVMAVISAEDYMDLKTDRTPAVLTTSEPIPLAHPASHLAILSIPLLLLGALPIPLNRPTWNLLLPPTRSTSFNTSFKISEPVLTIFTVYRDMAGLSKTQMLVQAR